MNNLLFTRVNSNQAGLTPRPSKLTQTNIQSTPEFQFHVYKQRNRISEIAPLEQPLFGGVDPQLPEPRRGGGQDGQTTGLAGGRFGRQGYGGSFGPSEIHQRRRRFPVSKGESFFFPSLPPRGEVGTVALRGRGGQEAIIDSGTAERSGFGW